MIGVSVDVDGLLAIGVEVAAWRALLAWNVVVTRFWDRVRLAELQVLVLRPRTGWLILVIGCSGWSSFVG